MKLALLVLLLVAGVLVAPKSSCRDVYIWWADGSVACKYLEEASIWGMHKNPDYWCNHYVLTDCCETCQRLRTELIIQ